MNERAPSPDGILKLKEAILTGFRALPGEHQATMGLVIVDTILKGEWGDWMKEALTIRFAEETDAGARFFPITSLSREDLQQVGLSDEERDELTDDDLETIARKMEDHYVNDWFWDELEFHARHVLEQKHKREGKATADS